MVRKVVVIWEQGVTTPRRAIITALEERPVASVQMLVNVELVLILHTVSIQVT